MVRMATTAEMKTRFRTPEIEELREAPEIWVSQKFRCPKSPWVPQRFFPKNRNFPCIPTLLVYIQNDTMKIGKRAEYGLRALINLGIAGELDRDRVTASDLAACDNLPLKFVEQIMGDLRAAGIIDTKRGRFGGYFIAKPMNTIKMGDLVRLLDGPLAPIACASHTAYEPCSCPDETHCGLRMLMIDVRNAISNILDKYTLENVVEVTLRKIRRDGAGHFFLDNANPATKPPSRAKTINEEDGFLAGLLEGKP